MTTQGLKRGLEADAWLASVIQNLHDLSDAELLEAGCLAGEDVTASSDSSTQQDTGNTTVNTSVNTSANTSTSVSDDVVNRYLTAQPDTSLNKAASNDDNQLEAVTTPSTQDN